MTSLGKKSSLRSKFQAWLPPPASPFSLPQSLGLHILRSIFPPSSRSPSSKIKQKWSSKSASRASASATSQSTILSSRKRGMVPSCFHPTPERSCPSNSKQSIDHVPPAEQHAIRSQWKSSAPTIPFPKSRLPQKRQTPSTRSLVYRRRRRGIRIYS
jgi:hypothetical protein